MVNITPHLWFDKEAKEAASFYAVLFPDSKVVNVTTIHDTPSGDADIVSFVLQGQPFMAISAGPLFRFNPSISFMVNFDPSKEPDARGRLDRLWTGLSEGGSALMPLDKYPFSERYGWVQDKYGLTWQLILSNPAGEERPPIIPSLLFTGAVAGRAEEAMAYYASVFPNSRRGSVARHPRGQEHDKEGTIAFADVQLNGQWLAVMDSAYPHGFAFNEAISLMVPCDTQQEIDYYWSKLSADPAAEQCGWCKDKFGVSWQVAPARMGEMLQGGTSAQRARVTSAFLPMKKFDLAKLEAAFRG